MRGTRPCLADAVGALVLEVAQTIHALRVAHRAVQVQSLADFFDSSRPSRAVDANIICCGAARCLRRTRRPVHRNVRTSGRRCWPTPVKRRDCNCCLRQSGCPRWRFRAAYLVGRYRGNGLAAKGNRNPARFPAHLDVTREIVTTCGGDDLLYNDAIGAFCRMLRRRHVLRY